MTKPPEKSNAPATKSESEWRMFGLATLAQRHEASVAAEKAKPRRPGGGEPELPVPPLAVLINLHTVRDEQLRTTHSVLAGSYAYQRMSVSYAVMTDSQHSAWLWITGPLYVQKFVAGLAPRDSIEEALATQLAVTNGRLMWLTVKLSEAREDADVARLSEAIDRATNTYRRLALAWHQIRGTAPVPPVPPTIVQNNAANQSSSLRPLRRAQGPPRTSRCRRRLRRPILVRTSRKHPMKKPYRLTPQGLEALRRKIAANRPWEKSTGPRTQTGKGRSSVNAFKHGERSRAAAQQRRQSAAVLRLAAEILRDARRAKAQSPANPT